MTETIVHSFVRLHVGVRFCGHIGTTSVPTRPPYLWQAQQAKWYVCKLRQNSCLDLGLEDVLQRHGVGRELGDPLAQLLHAHGVLVEVEAEVGLVVDVRFLLDVEGGGAGGVELLGNRGGGAHHLLEEVGLLDD